jgi:hypothetical protein
LAKFNARGPAVRPHTQRRAHHSVAGGLIFTAGACWAFMLAAATFAFSAATLALIRLRRRRPPSLLGCYG